MVPRAFEDFSSQPDERQVGSGRADQRQAERRVVRTADRDRDLREAGEAGQAEQAERALNSIPMKRIAHPDEIGELVLFMCSDACQFMTADTVYVSGGGGYR